MRILIAHDAAAGGGGVESYLAAIMPALVARGHDVSFLCVPSRTQTGPTRLDQVEQVFSIADIGFTRALTAVGHWRPDVCFSHNMRTLEVDERLVSSFPVVKMMHGYFGTCIGGQKAHTFPGVDACSREFGIACLGLYLPRRCGQLRPALMLSQFGWASRQRQLFDRYAHIVVASRHMTREYARHGLAPRQLTAAPLFPTASSTAAFRIPPPLPTVLFLGRMTPIKGGDTLIRAAVCAARLLAKPVRLAFAGNGPAEENWRTLAREQNVDAVFHGWVAGDARTALLRSASVIAVPSLWPEPFGLVGLEAAVHGVPAVGFDVGGIGEWLRDDVNGRLVPAVGSSSALGSAIARMLTSTSELLRLGEGAVRVASQLTLEAHLATVEAVLARAAAIPVTPLS
jgi:glycosyltransferase involved in cell wall biosynthesis